MRFQGEECVLNMASYFNRNDVVLNGTLWVQQSVGESTAYRHPWLRFTHTLPTTANDTLREWLCAVADDLPVEPLKIPGLTQYLYRLDAANPDEISLGFHYDDSTEPIWWAWAITSPLQVRLDFPRQEFAHLITVFDGVEWSFY